MGVFTHNYYSTVNCEDNMAVVGYEQQQHGKRWKEALWQARTVLDKGEEEGDYPVGLRELIISPTAVYDVLEKLGRGTFGQVVRCLKKDTREMVAMKILKSTPSYAKQGQMEVDVLMRLSRISSDEGSFVKAYESFQHQGHICIVFELLHINLYDYLKQSRFEPLPLKYIRPIAKQVLCCLEKLSSLGLVHADLKPENIMLVDPQRYPFRVKVIDFGSAMSNDKTTPSCYLQSRYYRAPEVIMGVAFNESIDMWSLGCVLAELYLGWPLFPGASEYDQITYICQTLGPLPAHLMRNVTKATRFFTCDNNHSWNLKSQTRYTQETGLQCKESRKYIFRSLLDLAHVGVQQSMDNQEAILTSLDRMEFISLLSRMLTLNPSQRIRPEAALQMPYIMMQHLAMHTQAHSIWEWFQCMQVCHQHKPSVNYSHHPSIPLLTPTPSNTSCPHIQVLSAPIVTPLYSVLPPRTHLVCHVAPSTFGYLPMATGAGPHYPTQEIRDNTVINPWLDQRVHPNMHRFPPQLCHCPPQVTPVVLSEGGAHHLHGNQTDSSFNSKLLPIHPLPSCHPFSRL